MNDQNNEYKSDKPPFKTGYIVENGFGIFPLNISRVYDSLRGYRIMTFASPNYGDIKDVFFINIEIPKLKKLENGNYQGVVPQVIFKPLVSPDNLELTKSGDFLNKYFDVATKDKPMKQCTFRIDEKLSQNFYPSQIFDKPLFLYLKDTWTDKNLFNLIIDWEKKWVVFLIDLETKNLFADKFFKIKQQNVDAKPKVEPSCIKSIDITGFDKKGEPIIEVYDNNSLRVQFNFMPPLNDSDDQSELLIFDKFDEKLAEVTNCKVVWDDQEVFIIENINNSTIKELTDFLSGFWKKKENFKLKPKTPKLDNAKLDSEVKPKIDIVKYYSRLKNPTTDRKKNIEEDNTGKSALSTALKILGQIFR